ncbi:MAG: hypothetical protein ACUVV0_16940 [Anaerolineae bacterium]
MFSLIQTFGLRHFLLVRSLQGKGVSLDLEKDLTRASSPLRDALAARFLVANLDTYVLDGPGKGEIGFTQVRERRGRPEMDVVYMAPSLDHDEAEETWCRLLTYLCKQAGEQGTQRLFASLPEGGPEVEVFRQVGFVVHAREEIFRLEPSVLAQAVRPPPLGEVSIQAHIRRRHEGDIWSLQKLYTAITPRLVRQVEGPHPWNWGIGMGWWLGWPRREAYILEDGAGEVGGYTQINRGDIGHWLRLAIHPGAQQYASDLVRFSLHLLATLPPRPVYCSLREYETGLRGPLEDWGFAPFDRRVIVVKHATVWVREPSPYPASHMEKRAEATTTYGRACTPPAQVNRH